MPAFVKTPEDERLWAKAKEQAKAQGEEGNWAYVTGIFKKMKGGKVGGSNPVETYKNLRAYWDTNHPQWRIYGVHTIDEGMEVGRILFDKGAATWTVEGYPKAPSDAVRTKVNTFTAKDDREGVKKALMLLTDWTAKHLKTAKTDPVEELAIRVLFEEDRRSKTAKSNAKVVEVPNTFHQVELQEPKATRKEFPFEGFIDFQGLKIDVENAKGSTRSGTGPEGDWSTSVLRVARRYMVAKEMFEVPISTSTVKVLPPRKKRKEYPFEGFINFQGLAIHVENVRGSTREGVDSDGTPWKVTMKHHYGEVDQTEGVDHDPVDIYVGPNGDSPLVVVVRQQDPKTKKYDEDKVMVGFNTEDEAVEAYKAQYNSAGFYQSHKSMPIGRFLRWCLNRDNRGKKVSRFNGGSSLGRAW